MKSCESAQERISAAMSRISFDYVDLNCCLNVFVQQVRVPESMSCMRLPAPEDICLHFDRFFVAWKRTLEFVRIWLVGARL